MTGFWPNWVPGSDWGHSSTKPFDRGAGGLFAQGGHVGSHDIQRLINLLSGADDWSLEDTQWQRFGAVLAALAAANPTADDQAVHVARRELELLAPRRANAQPGGTPMPPEQHEQRTHLLHSLTLDLDNSSSEGQAPGPGTTPQDEQS